MLNLLKTVKLILNNYKYPKTIEDINRLEAGIKMQKTMIARQYHDQKLIQKCYNHVAFELTLKLKKNGIKELHDQPVFQ